ncbi:MAG: cytochrome ubiquinol oxidase subunit I [Humidesulfovibrio sp.]|nr:cytochrome ubiquinol oxidase subunit I [Humidesulfovibrio sp.]
MEYPIWQLSTLAGGFWIALIGTFHVFLAHFAVGGGLYLVLTEIYARRLGSPLLLTHVKKHTRFFLLITMVAGGVTGVGIWFTIGLLSPQATSTLLKIFVYGFATEWVFFLAEIVALLVYYYGFDHMEAKDHLRMGWLYFLFALLSLFMINGIVGFMLTPGQWMTTRNFWDGFFNPTFWPQFFLRTAIALTLAGLFGFVTATRIPNENGAAEARERMVRLAAGWTILPILVCLAAGWWYIRVLPLPQQEMVLLRSARIAGFVKDFQYFAGAAALGALLLAVKMPGRVRFPLALLVLLTGWGLIGSFEFVREAARKPYLIYGHTYSNGIRVGAALAASEAGYLATAKWARIREITPENRLAAGAELYQHQCASCHSIGGPMNDIKPWAATLTAEGLAGLLESLNLANPAMPPFVGNRPEREALAAYLSEGLLGAQPVAEAPVALAELPLVIPPFDAARDEYVLLAWPGLGMHMAVEAQGVFSLRPATAELSAQLIRRGDAPTKITDGVELTCAVEGAKEGGGQPVAMKLLDGRDWFQAPAIPASPRGANGGFNPYPLVTVEARDMATRTVLARTRAVLPVSDEVGCASCHGGARAGSVAGAGISPETGQNILRIHDRMNRTSLAAQAKAGQPVACTSCHADPLTGAEGRAGLMGISSALHGFHASTLKGRGAEACAHCHPSRPDGATRFLRGLHAQAGLDCVTCHGALEDHAVGLLKRELEGGKRGARRLLTQITPLSGPQEKIPPRTAWTQTPDCLACHQGFGAPDPSRAFGNWTKAAPERFKSRLDEMGALSCPACHGPQHALYPAKNPYGRDRDNIQPLQYQKLAKPLGSGGNCSVCHKGQKTDPLHHPNLIRKP